MKTKKIPMRMCVGCREMKPKKELIRVVRNAEGAISLDMKGKAPGRGAYVCALDGCISKAIRIRALDRALNIKTGGEIEAGLLEELARRSDE